MTYKEALAQVKKIKEEKINHLTNLKLEITVIVNVSDIDIFEDFIEDFIEDNAVDFDEDFF